MNASEIKIIKQAAIKRYNDLAVDPTSAGRLWDGYVGKLNEKSASPILGAVAGGLVGGALGQYNVPWDKAENKKEKTRRWLHRVLGAGAGALAGYGGVKAYDTYGKYFNEKSRNTYRGILDMFT